jgi:Tol biopolymer transport system component
MGRFRYSLFAVALVSLGLSGTAHATFPGANGKIAYSGCGSTDCGIFVIQPDGSGATQITHNPNQFEGEPLADLRAAWSADGQRILFTRQASLGDLNVGQDLYVVNANGSGLAQLTSTARDEDYPSWSPDGQRIAYTRTVPGQAAGEADLIVADADASNPTAIAFPAFTTDWSPDGSAIAYARKTGADPHQYELHLVAPDGSGDHAITSSDPGSPFENEQPSWSPGGGLIALTREPASSPHEDVWSMNADGTGLTNLTATPGNDEQDPSWSPDGSRIAFYSPIPPSGLPGIWTMSPDGSGRTRLTSGSDPAWQPVPVKSYVRPKSASPMRVSLVTAYKPCTAPNRTHGPPLAFGSCAPPAPGSQYLTVGTADANGQPAKGTGFVRMRVFFCPACAGPVNEDVFISASLTDVRNRADLSDYKGELGTIAGLRITDRYNGPGQDEPATVKDFPFAFTVPCAETGDTGVGSTCSVDTSLTALVPGAVRQGARAVWELGQVEVSDGGADGVAATQDNTPFERAGVFVP